MRDMWLVLPLWCIKIPILIKKNPKYLVNSRKSSTFAPDFALNASERLTTAKLLKNVMLKISHLRIKAKKCWKKLLKNLVSPKKSSTFAADFAMNASERLLAAKLLKNVMLKISHLQRKAKKYWKKLLKNLVSSKKSSTFAVDFATNENWCEILVIFESLINQWCSTREQAIAQLGNWKTCNTKIYYTVPVKKYTID